MALLFMPFLVEYVVTCSENILTELTDLERDSTKRNDFAKVISRSVQVESEIPTSRLSI